MPKNSLWLLQIYIHRIPLSHYANEMPLEIRREHLTLKYFLEIKSQFANPAINSVTPSTDRLLINNKMLPQTVRSIQTSSAVTSYVNM